jgi:hypothetical protein
LILPVTAKHNPAPNFRRVVDHRQHPIRRPENSIEEAEPGFDFDAPDSMPGIEAAIRRQALMEPYAGRTDPAFNRFPLRATWACAKRQPSLAVKQRSLGEITVKPDAATSWQRKHRDFSSRGLQRAVLSRAEGLVGG